MIYHYLIHSVTTSLFHLFFSFAGEKDLDNQKWKCQVQLDSFNSL